MSLEAERHRRGMVGKVPTFSRSQVTGVSLNAIAGTITLAWPTQVRTAETSRGEPAQAMAARGVPATPGARPMRMTEALGAKGRWAHVAAKEVRLQPTLLAFLSGDNGNLDTPEPAELARLVAVGGWGIRRLCFDP